MEMTKEWLKANYWFVRVEDKQQAESVLQWLSNYIGREAVSTLWDRETIIGFDPHLPQLWSSWLPESYFDDNDITSLVLAEMQAKNEKQMSEQKYIPVPEGGWTKDNLPLEFEYDYEDGEDGCIRRITKIIKPSKEQQMKEAAQSVDNNSPLPFLKPFVRLVTRGKGTYIYQGVREQHTLYPGMHHAVRSDSCFDVWDDTLSYEEYSEYEVLAIYDYPKHAGDLLNIDKKGKLLWQREDSKLKELQQTVEEATKALEDYKKEKGVA